MHTSPFAAIRPRHQHHAGAYSHVGLHTSVASASPHQLVTLLFEGYFGAVNRAKGALQQGNIAGMGVAIGQAVRIVEEGLKAGLDAKRGGSLAADLNDLYGWVTLRLTQANLHADVHALDECSRVMQPLREAWASIASPAHGATVTATGTPS